jgi:hypothetical protein
VLDIPAFTHCDERRPSKSTRLAESLKALGTSETVYLHPLDQLLELLTVPL